MAEEADVDEEAEEEGDSLLNHVRITSSQYDSHLLLVRNRFSFSALMLLQFSRRLLRYKRTS